MKIKIMQLKHGTGGMMSNKWCPFVRLAKDGICLITNRGEVYVDAKQLNCIKEKCACWIEIWTYNGKTDREIDLGHCGLINNG